MVWGGGFPLGTPEGLLAPGSGKSSPKKGAQPFSKEPASTLQCPNL